MMHWKQAKIIYGGLALAYKKESKSFFWDNIIYSVRTLIEPLVLLIFWQTIASANLATDVSSITIYFISAALIQRFSSSWVGEDLKRRIQTGELNQYLLTPGSAILNFVTFELDLKRRRLMVTIPVTIILFLLFLPHLNYTPHYLQLLALFIVLPCSYIIFFSMRMMIACLAFWFFNITGWEDISNAIEPFLDGSFIPLIFLPSSIAIVLKILPFRYVYSFALELISFDLPTHEVVWSLFTMLGWTTILVLCGYFVWHKGLKRYNG